MVTPIADPSQAAKAFLPFEQVHPALRALLCAAILIITLGCFSTALLAISLLVGLVLSSYLRSASAALRSLAHLAPWLLFITILNPLISPSGTRLLVSLGPFPIYLESLEWGLLMGLMLCASVVWFENFSFILSIDELCDLLGAKFPTFALAVSMTLRLVPDLSRQARGAKEAREACTAASLPRQMPAPTSSAAEKPSPQPLKPSTYSRSSFHWVVRVSTALLQWSLVDSQERASSMMARGWGLAPRTHYHQWRWTWPQKLLTAALIICSAVLLGSFLFSGAGWGPSATQLFLGPSALQWPLIGLSSILLATPLIWTLILSYQDRRAL